MATRTESTHAPTDSVIIVDGSRFLAVRRAHEPQTGWWDVPGGFCDAWEAPADAAAREAREELGLQARLDRFIDMHMGGYVHQVERVPVLDCFWQASVGGGNLTLNTAEVTEHA